MNDYSSKTVLVADFGLFLPLARKLTESFGRVLYWVPSETGFPLIERCHVGDGFEGVERVRDPWLKRSEVDLWVFPDIQFSGMQLALEEDGARVWGSRSGDAYELNRKRFLEALAQVGLPVPPYERVIGLEELRSCLMAAGGPRYVKISRYRGTMETWKHVTMEQSEPKLAELSVKLGPLANTVPFIVCEPVDAPVEMGADTYCIDGSFPDWIVHGIEHKDKSYIGTWQARSDLPEELNEILDKFGPLLGVERYRNLFSVEARDGRFIDPCCRFPSPGSEAQLEMIGNLPDVLWIGADGELVQPERAFEFAVQAVVTVKARNGWNAVEVPAQVDRWVKLKNATAIGDTIGIKTDEDLEIGWVVGVGDTLQNALDHALDTAAALEGSGLTVDTMALAEAVQDVQAEEDSGSEFTAQQVPDAQEVATAVLDGNGSNS